MKRVRIVQSVIASLGLTFGVLAGRAAASSTTFSFVMERRGVDGQKNNKLHSLDAGELTFSGGYGW